jgi:hypothetical protein
MPDVTMWWARTDWFWNTPAGLAITPRANGLELAGNIWGPTGGGLFVLPERQYRVRIVSSYWLGTDRMPATGSDWRSRAQDRSTGLIVGYTYGGGGALFSYPQTQLVRWTRHRVFSGSTLISSEQRMDYLVQIYDSDTSSVVSLPLHGVFTGVASQTFNFDRTQNLGIEVELEFVVFFRGDGRLRLDAVLISVPQFDIRSTA